MSEIKHIAARVKGDDGVTRLYVAAVVSSYPTAADLPADAPGDQSATVNALEAMLDGSDAAAVPPGTIGNEAQLIGR